MNLNLIKKKFFDSGVFNMLKAVSVIGSILIVVFSYKFFSFKIYSDIQSDYALYLFMVLIFNFGLNPVSQIIGNNKTNLFNEFKMVIIFFIFLLFVLNFFLPKSLLLKFVSFSENNFSLIYGWPLLVVQNIFSFYFLGKKKYLLHFSIPIINNFLILIGLVFYLNTNNYDLIFLLPIIFSLIILLYLLFSTKYLKIKITHLKEIFHLWKINILPVLSSFTGVKNINYFIITFIGKEFFGIFKLLHTIFNFINFFISSEITIIVNNSLKLGNRILHNMKSIIFLKKVILMSNFIFVLVSYFIDKFIYNFFEFDFLLFVSFSIINVFNLIYILDNNVMFVAKRNSLRVYSDLISFSIIILYCFLLSINKTFLSLTFYMYGIITIYILNFILSNYLYYYKKKS
tara:strand:+ start:14264 stop:15463 length:1200 start_codon:yes stop_codon:yes gene_type:complete